MVNLLSKVKNNGCIEIICDGGRDYGFGHIRRSHTLARALVCSGYQVRYIAASKSGNMLLPEFKSSGLDAAIQIIDLPYDINSYFAIKGTTFVPVIALDYFEESAASCVISIYEHNAPVPSGTRVSGLEYALIRPEIVNHKTSTVAEGVVVMIGGSDLNQIGDEVVERLENQESLITLVQGPANQVGYVVTYPNVIIVKSPLDLEERMSKCTWAVTNGGSSMLEMMCLGKAVHVVPQTEAEKVLAQIVLRDGGILGVGMDTLRTPNPDSIARIGKKAKELVDGNGSNRIIRIIEEYLR